MAISLLWLRRDLRLQDHAPLAAALAAPCKVQPVFVLDTDILQAFPNPTDRRVRFLARALMQLHRQLLLRGGGLLVLHGSAQALLPRLAQVLDVQEVFAGEDFEPGPMARDAAVKANLAPHITLTTKPDHVMCGPNSVLKGDGTPFKVFTPFFKKWRSLLTPVSAAAYEVEDAGRYADYTALRQACEQAQLPLLPMDGGEAGLLAGTGYSYADDSAWPVDDVDGQLQRFVAQKLAAYATGRDMLADGGTSRLSPYLRFGLVSIRACVRAAEDKPGSDKWIAELAWREFYIAILHHFPHTVHSEFQAQYRGRLPWSENHEAFAVFCEGRTGYPVVDAAIRQLLTTGWMHNRARMIVASFLTKDLFIDWRWGEQFFSQHLMDYEQASNVGGWQWAASTGTDAAPYFRVFNPVLQSKRFDPDGAYIRTYVPELAEMDTRDIHAPWESLMRPLAYPLPMVDHATAKEHAVAAFKGLSAPLP